MHLFRGSNPLGLSCLHGTFGTVSCKCSESEESGLDTHNVLNQGRVRVGHNLGAGHGHGHAKAGTR